MALERDLDTMTVTIDNAEIAATAVENHHGWFLVGCLEKSGGLTQIGIGKAPFTVGRALANDLRLSSRNVSKRHAQLIVTFEAVLVRDLRSTNGTYVNGKRINVPTPVGDGDLLQFADMEFRLGRESARTGDHTIVSDSPEHGWLISQLHEVINCNRFEMVFQPIVSAVDLRPIAVEALVRSDVAGLESPLQLFTAAERLGLEDRLSELCRVKAVRTLSRYSARQRLFLNTHPNEQLGPELVASLRALRELDRDRPLVLEIHEAAVPNLAAIREFRSALCAMDVGLAYDDFGAGQSRLLELTEVPPDYLKFDRSLLEDNAVASVGRRTLLKTLLAHAADAGIATVAEGIDSPELVAVCRELGFTHLQGYYLGRPAPPQALATR